MQNNPTRIRGEFTLILGPVDASLISKGGDNGESEKILSKLRALKADSVSRSEAVKLVTEITGVSKSIVYKLALDEPWPNRK